MPEASDTPDYLAHGSPTPPPLNTRASSTKPQQLLHPLQSQPLFDQHVSETFGPPQIPPSQRDMSLTNPNFRPTAPYVRGVLFAATSVQIGMVDVPRNVDAVVGAMEEEIEFEGVRITSWGTRGGLGGTGGGSDDVGRKPRG